MYVEEKMSSSDVKKHTIDVAVKFVDHLQCAGCSVRGCEEVTEPSHVIKELI
jgi:hypothetical protein